MNWEGMKMAFRRAARGSCVSTTRQTEVQKMSEGADEEQKRGSSAVFDWPEDVVSPHCDETLLSHSDEPGHALKQTLRGELSDAYCEALASQLKTSRLTELDLSRSSLSASGTELICAALESPLCTLKTLRLSDCILSERCCTSLASALKSNPSYLRELDLSGNKSLTHSTVKLLCAGLESPHCRLRTLRLVYCGLTESSCASLLSALRSNPNSNLLKELDLSGNNVQDAGMWQLCALMMSPMFTLETLRLSSCGLSAVSCGYLALALMSNPYYLEELDLSLNQLQDSGIKHLSNGLTKPFCKLNTLRLISCQFSDVGYTALISALKSNCLDLMELDLSGNELKDRGKTDDELMIQSHYKLQTLRVDDGQNLMTFSSFTPGPHPPRPPPPPPSPPPLPELLGTSSSSLMQNQGARLRRLGKRKLTSSQSDFFKTTDAAGDPKKEKSKVETEFTKFQDKLPFTRQKYSALQALSSSSQLELATSDTASSDSHLPLDPNRVNTELDWLEIEAEKMEGPSGFTPKLLNERGVTSYRFRAPCPGVFQCALTRLMFTMTGEGELLYRIIQWDDGLLQSAGKIPAGPLFNIQCSGRAVSQLHLPHCEPEPDSRSDVLSVVHISDDGMNILNPVRITDTHVVVDVPHFSAFGLVWDYITRFLNNMKPISGQILLFHRPANMRPSQKVNVFLLPENVPLQEVKSQQENAEYIEATSYCHLVKGQSYTVNCCEASRIQPHCIPFDLKYGPNYHPTFEIRLTPSTTEATVRVRDQKARYIWEYHVELTDLPSTLALSLTAPSTQSTASEPSSLPAPAGERGPEPSSQNLHRTQSFPTEEERLLSSVRTEFINRVSSSVLSDLLNILLDNSVINTRETEQMHAMPRTSKGQELIDTVLRKGQQACKILIDALREVDPYLSETLQLN